MPNTRLSGSIVRIGILSLISGLTWVSVLATEPSAERGKRLYEQGIGADGKAVTAVTQNDLVFTGRQISCASCHRISGFGSSEGGNYIPAITAPDLFQVRQWDRAELFKKLFKESQPKRFHSRVRSQRDRPAYDDTNLARAIREGRDPTGRPLDALMPRYRLSDTDIADLIAYLRQLSPVNDPGVTKTHLRIATVFSENVAPAKRQAIEATIAEFVAWMNLDSQGDLRHPNFSPNYRSQFISAYRLWQWQPWVLRGEPNSWPQQLETYYRDRTPFVLIGGMVDGSWQAIEQFCEQKQLPSLFPLTELVPANGEPKYTVYFNRGLILEAELIASHLRERGDAAPRQLVQLHAEEPMGQVPAQAFANLFPERMSSELMTHSFDSQRSFDRLLKRVLRKMSADDALVIWPPPGLELGPLLQRRWSEDRPWLFLPSHVLADIEPGLADRPFSRLRLAYPYEAPGAYHPRAFRVRAWMRTRGLALSHSRLQFNTYYGLTLLQYGLEHIVHHFSRDYLMEYVEHEAENALNPGTFPRLSLGPGQRYASKGGFIVRLKPKAINEGDRVEPVSEWIVP